MFGTGFGVGRRSSTFFVGSLFACRILTGNGIEFVRIKGGGRKSIRCCRGSRMIRRRCCCRSKRAQGVTRHLRRFVIQSALVVITGSIGCGKRRDIGVGGACRHIGCDKRIACGGPRFIINASRFIPFVRTYKVGWSAHDCNNTKERSLFTVLGCVVCFRLRWMRYSDGCLPEQLFREPSPSIEGSCEFGSIPDFVFDEHR